MKKYSLLIVLFSLLWSCEKDNDEAIIKACFTYQFSDTNEGEIQFTNCSENALSYFWEFYDGETSTEKNPLHKYTIEPPYYVTLIAKRGYLADTLTGSIGNIMVYKPNIYIYPKNEINLCLEIEFPLGGKVVTSIPEHKDEWCVNVQPDGLIDNQYSYLFYESSQPDIFHYEKGWCIAKENLLSFFESNMQQYKFSQQEIIDFTEYWIPRLTESNYYLVYPQTNEIIDKAIRFNFSVQPDNVGRLFYAIRGTNAPETLPEPEITPFKRTNYFVMEWGVILK